MFENRVLRKLCEAKRGEIRGEWRKQRTEELCDLYEKLFLASHEGGPNGQDMWHVWCRRNMSAGFLLGKTKEAVRLVNQDVNRRVIKN